MLIPHLMNALELRIPPPVIALLVAAAMWGISLASPSVDVPARVRMAAAIILALAGVGTAFSGAAAFRHAKTTVNPRKPDTATSLVTSGVYRFTRNPMYVGLGLILLGWAVFLSAALAFLGPVAFILYISRFQIAPEETALSRVFGAAYSAYRAQVRRWL